jgi:hypothetical protein
VEPQGLLPAPPQLMHEYEALVIVEYELQAQGVHAVSAV